MDTLRNVYVYLNYWRVLPTYIFLLTNKMKEKSKKDFQVWKREVKENRRNNGLFAFGYVMLYRKEFRNIVLNRLHRNPIMWLITRILFHPLDSLYIEMPPEKIGGVIHTTWLFYDYQSK